MSPLATGGTTLGRASLSKSVSHCTVPENANKVCSGIKFYKALGTEEIPGVLQAFQKNGMQAFLDDEHDYDKWSTKDDLMTTTERLLGLPLSYAKTAAGKLSVR
jgi:hypothetical protein